MLNSIILKYKNYVYIPIPKNASTTHRNFFMENNWEEVRLRTLLDYKGIDKLNFFSHIQDPNIRHTKGIIEWNRRKTLDIDIFENLNILSQFSSSMIDEHTYSLAHTCPYILHRIHWIPIDLKIGDKLIHSSILTNLYFEENNLPFLINESFDAYVSKKEEIDEKTLRIVLAKENLSNDMKEQLDMILELDTRLWKESKKYYTRKYI